MIPPSAENKVLPTSRPRNSPASVLYTRQLRRIFPEERSVRLSLQPTPAAECCVLEGEEAQLSLRTEPLGARWLMSEPRALSFGDSSRCSEFPHTLVNPCAAFTPPEMLTQGLREYGYVVDLAADGEEGLEKIYINRYGLVILDVVLPRKDGFAAQGVAVQVQPRGPRSPLTMRRPPAQSCRDQQGPTCHSGALPQNGSTLTRSAGVRSKC